MTTHGAGTRQPFSRKRSAPGGWFLLLLFLQSACATGPRHGLRGGHGPPGSNPSVESTRVYTVGFLDPGALTPGPVPIARAEFKRALLLLARDVQVRQKSPREAAHDLLQWLTPPQDVETLASQGDWRLETYAGQGYAFVPERQAGPVALTPQAGAVLKTTYLTWCEHQGGGDCLGLLDDGDLLRTDDRRTLALALAFGSVLDETRAALGRELLDTRALVAMVVWTVALYCTLWVVPEPTTKLLAASLTVLLLGYLGLGTVYGLMDGWAVLADTAHHATTFEELRAAGEAFGRVLGEDAARALILAVTALGGHTLGQVLPRVKMIPGFHLANARFQAQGGALLAPVEAVEATLAAEGALARAVVAADAVALSPQGPLAVVMLKTRAGGGTVQASGGRSCKTVLRHREGNQQVELSDGQRWHLPRGKSATDIPAEDKVGDLLQDTVDQAAKQWGPHRLSNAETAAIRRAEKQGEYWLARLLEREARGRYVHEAVKKQFKGYYRFDHQGVDVVDLAPGGLQYEILSGTESNLARHGRRMADVFFRMLTF